jgi:hypothetical protein
VGWKKQRTVGTIRETTTRLIPWDVGVVSDEVRRGVIHLMSYITCCCVDVVVVVVASAMWLIWRCSAAWQSQWSHFHRPMLGTNSIWTRIIFRKKSSLHACFLPRNHDSTPFNWPTPALLSGVGF